MLFWICRKSDQVKPEKLPSVDLQTPLLQAANGAQQSLYNTGAKVLCHANFDSTAREFPTASLSDMQLHIVKPTPSTFFLRADAADIIEQRVSAAGGVSYYVHYVDCKSPCPVLALRCLAVWSDFAGGPSNNR